MYKQFNSSSAHCDNSTPLWAQVGQKALIGREYQDAKSITPHRAGNNILFRSIKQLSKAFLRWLSAI